MLVAVPGTVWPPHHGNWEYDTGEDLKMSDVYVDSMMQLNNDAMDKETFHCDDWNVRFQV